MSGRRAVTNLEEFFLHLRERGPRGASRSRGFGEIGPSTRCEHLVLTSTFTTFGQLSQDPEKSSLDMNSPIATVLAFAPQTPAARQRAIAAIGGVAATALVVVGVTSGVPHGPGSGQSQQALAQARQGGPHLPPLDGPPSRRGGASTGGAARQASNIVHRTAAGSSGANVLGSFSIFNGAASGGSSTPGASASSGGGSATGGTSPLPSVPNPVTTALSPVTQLTSNVGSTISTTVQQINATVPAAAPITGQVNDVGTTVSGLSGTLATPNA
jgi:hypothetical protein